METDRQTIHAMTVQALEGEGEWCLASECHVGEDDDG